MSKLFQLIFNFTAKNIVFFLQVQIILLCYISSANSISFEERQEIYRKHGCEEGKCDIFEIESLSRQKRSVDSTISFSLKRYGSDKVLNFRKSNGILVGDNTPVFFGKSIGSGVYLEKQLRLFSSEIRSQLYEDEANLAVVTIDFNSDDELEIKCGYIGAESLLFNGLLTIDKRHVLVETKFDDSTEDILDALASGSTQLFRRSGFPIPDVIYPEILVIVDYNLYKNFNQEAIIPYLFLFWSIVDMFFRQLQNPKYKLSIAGVLIPEDLKVFQFLKPSILRNSLEYTINYEIALDIMSGWLIQEKLIIPFSSYDVFMIMTPYGYKQRHQTYVGLAKHSGTCSGINNSKPKGGIIYEPNNLQSIITAAHELGHTFGAEHDSSDSIEKYIMTDMESFPITHWSANSTEYFHRTLEERDFSCMYNEPDIEKDKPFHITLPVNERLVVGKYDFVTDQVIKIYYEDNTLIVTQVNTRKLSVAKNLDDSFLKIAVTDDNVLEVDPDKISQLSEVNIYHEDQFIYAYQGRKPVPENYNNVLESNPKDLSPNYFENDDTEMCFNKMDFDSDKLVKIYYENNKIHVSQRNVPDNESPNERKSSYLQYIGSELGIIYLYLIEINWDKEVCVQHDDASIFVYQGKKPDLNRWEDNSGKIKYLPDESYVNRKLPESKDRKQRPDFYLTLDTEYTLSIFPNEFNQKKLVSISFENDKLIISQIGTPEENRVEENMLSEDANVMFFTRDVNKLLLHPGRVTSKKIIHIIHEQNLIKIWQGTFDNPPSMILSMLHIIEVFTPDNPIVIEGINLTIEDEEMLELYPGTFDLHKIVYVAYRNNKLRITQNKIASEFSGFLQNHSKLRIITPDSETVEFLPALTDTKVKIKMRHKNDKIYVWQGDNMPEISDTNP